MGFDMERLLELATVPPELGGVEQEPVSGGLKYDDLMALIRRLEVEAYDGAPDVFEAARTVRCVNDTDGDGNCAACARLGDEAPCRQRETRRQAKSRIMLEHYADQGFPIRDHDLWQLRAAYSRVYQFVQSDGLPYSTHNWQHYYNRYGMAGGRVPVYMIGLRKDTIQEMGVQGIRESQAREALRVLGAWGQEVLSIDP